MANKKFYSDVEIKADIILENETPNTVPVVDASGKVKSSAVTSTELGHLSGVTSGVQAQIDAADQAAADAQADATQALADAAAAQADADQVAADLAQEILDREADVDAEETRALAAEAALGVRIDDVEADIAALPDPMTYNGLYNATTNSPALVDGTGNNGDLYHVSVAGTQDFGNGNITFVVGDKVVYNGATAKWEKWDLSDSVSSVNGETGAVVLKADDINRADDSETIEASLDSLETDVAAAQADATQALADAAAAQQDIDDHLADTTGAHAASAISLAAISGISATDVQAGIAELKSEIDAIAPTGDIPETSFALANNQSTPANVTGLAFSNAVVRSFDALVSVEIDAGSDVYESVKLHGLRRGSDWVMSVEGVGDDSGVVFTITNAGQVQYTSPNSASFVSGSLKFRAIVTRA